MTVAEAAKEIGLSVDAVYDLCRSGLLPHRRIGPSTINTPGTMGWLNDGVSLDALPAWSYRTPGDGQPLHLLPLKGGVFSGWAILAPSPTRVKSPGPV